MRRIYTLHPWDLADYDEEQLLMLQRDLLRLENAITQTRR